MAMKRILAVDDDATNLKLVSAVLTQHGYDCRCEKSGQDALEAVQVFRPDLMLVDVMMPDMDGFELTSQIKSNNFTKHIPVILLTSLSDRESRLQGLDSGAEEFVSKPIDKKELMIRVRNLLRLQDVSDQLAKHKMSLETKVQVRTEELYDTRLDLVCRLSQAAEFKDKQTSLHITRVSRISYLIAQALGLSDEQCDLILNAAPMHDIGKVGIPDNILLKPGKLTESEWEIMKTHTSIGFRILDSDTPSHLLNMARSIAYCHHEKWDGSGYPRGLAGKDIPVEARIVALADVFDTLLSKRPYRDAWTKDEAVAEISAQKDMHFQALLVETFFDLMPEIDEILQEFSDEGR